MVFSKRMPKDVKGSPYPKWIEVGLTDIEEKEQELASRKENLRLVKECIEDAKGVVKELNLKPYQTGLVNLGIALFDKRASHTVFWKESKIKEKFDQMMQ